MIRRRGTSLAGAPRSRARLARPAPLSIPVGAAPPPAPAGPWPRRLAWGAGFAVIGGLLLWLLWPVLAILVAAAAIAYVLDPLVDRFERRGMSRELGIGALLVAGVLAGAVVTLLMVPPFVRKLGEIGVLLADFFSTIDQRVLPLAAKVEELTGRSVPLDLTELQAQVPQLIEEGLPRVQATATKVFQGLFTQGMGLISAILNLTLLPLFAFYLLRDWDRLIAMLHDLIPPTLRPRVERVAREVDGRLAAFVRGQLTVCAALGVIYSLGLWIAGIDLPFTVGMLAGALFIVPYLGTLVGVVLASLLAVVEYGIDVHLLWVALVFGGAQALEGYLLTPKIVGDKVGLHPLVVIIALLVGGSLLGIWGMLLAIPITATLSVLGAEWLDLYRGSAVYRDGRQG
ncbi:AI-2E family transporter [Myxococcota bacterium]|nr:AI-2E family transporter [Myxococcota bacterium]